MCIRDRAGPPYGEVLLPVRAGERPGAGADSIWPRGWPLSGRDVAERRRILPWKAARLPAAANLGIPLVVDCSLRRRPGPAFHRSRKSQ